MMLLALLATAGSAIDYGKWHNGYMHAEAAMDSALLAAGREFQTDPNAVEAALAAAQANFNQSMTQGIGVVGSPATFVVTQDPLGVPGTFSGYVTTPFLGLINVAHLPVHLSSQVEYGIGGSGGGGTSSLEVSLMLDVTGSMCNDGVGPCTTGTKIDALKTSAKDLVSIVVRNTTSAKVALVPFSTRVRVAPDSPAIDGVLMKKLTNLDPKWTGWIDLCTNGTGGGGSETGVPWVCTARTPTHFVNMPVMPCVSDRTGPQEFTDAAPANNAWLNGHTGDRWPKSDDSSEAPSTANIGQTAATAADQWTYDTDGGCADIANSDIILPLSNDKTTITARIDGLQAYGSTSGALGTAWAWYMLSPNWNNIWTGTSQPGSYADLAPVSGGTPKLRKIAVLMTDGGYNTYRTWKDADPVAVSNNAKALCANMKAQGIEVFTVGFDLDALPAAERTRAVNTLTACGTDVQHFYNSLDANQLKTAFRDIALKLSQLYISK